MEIKLDIKDDYDYFLKVLRLLDKSSPFSKMTAKETEFYAHVLVYNSKFKYVPLEQRNFLIFNYETRHDIAEKIDVSIDSLYNMMTRLKKKGIIGKDTLIPKYLIPKMDKVTFKFNFQ